MKKVRKSKLLRLAVFAFFVYICVQLVANHVQINKRQAEYARVTSSAVIQEAKNQQTQRMLNTQNQNQYTEQEARNNLNYAKPGEKVFIIADN